MNEIIYTPSSPPSLPNSNTFILKLHFNFLLTPFTGLINISLGMKIPTLFLILVCISLANIMEMASDDLKLEIKELF